MVNALRADNERLTRERDEARDHARKHMPTIARIRDAHTQMPLDQMMSKGDWGHRVYTQGQDEGCYLCALIIHAEAAEAKVARLTRERDGANTNLERVQNHLQHSVAQVARLTAALCSFLEAATNASLADDLILDREVKMARDALAPAQERGDKT
jgi:hypothetical protein